MESRRACSAVLILLTILCAPLCAQGNGTITVLWNGTSLPPGSAVTLTGPPGSAASTSITLQATTPANFTITSNQVWLAVTPASGIVSPGASVTVTLTGNALSLPLGTNNASITITSNTAPAVVAPVAFNVGPFTGLSLNPHSMVFRYTTSTTAYSPAQTQLLSVSGASAFASYTAASNNPTWLLVNGVRSQSSISVLQPVVISVNAAAVGNQLGTYNGTVSILTSDGLSGTLNVIFTIANGLTFTVTAVGGSAEDQSILINGSGDYVASAVLNGGSTVSWLSVNPSSGTLSSVPTLLTVSVNPAGLAAGTYTGFVSIFTNGLLVNGSNTELVNVTLTIGGGAGGGPVASPGSLVFNLPQGGTQRQTIIVNGDGSPFTAQALGIGLSLSSTSGTTPALLTVTANASGLAVGSSTVGSLNLTSSFGTQVVGVTTNVLAGNILTANPGDLTFLNPSGNSPVAITSTADVLGTHLGFTITSLPSFVTATASGNTTPTVMSVGINTAAVVPGFNSGNIVLTVNSGIAANSTLTVPVTVLGPNAATILSATPNPVNVAAVAGGPPVTTTVAISGLTGMGITSTSTSSGWLSVSQSAVTSPANLTLTVDPSLLLPNTYSGSVTVTATNGIFVTIMVTANVSAPPVPILSVSPAVVNFAYRQGSAPPAAAQTQFTSSAVGLFTISVTGAPWLMVTPASGTAPAILTLRVDPAVLPVLSAGQYSGSVTINARGASLAFPVTLSVAATIPAVNLTVWRPANGTWYVNPITATPFTQQWGLPGDIPVAGDFNNDGSLDYVVWRPSNGIWFVTLSGTGTVITKPLGMSGDIPVAGDFDGDGITDFAVWRPSNGTWYIIPSGNPSDQIVKQWGLPGDIPVVADFDGDGKADYAVWRPAEGNWYITLSGTGATLVKQWGYPGDVPVAADYDGDGKADIAVWRPAEGNWYILPSGSPTTVTVRQWGVPGDIPVPRDYDGDGKADLGVWRPSNGTWYIIPSATPAAPLTLQWGLPSDVPIYRPAGS